MASKFSIVGCEHAHIEIFIAEMIALGYECAGLYEPNNVRLAKRLADQFALPIVTEQQRLFAEDVAIIGSSAINNEKIGLIETCERYGKPVMIDKPAVTNRGDFERLQAVIERGKIEVGMLLTERFNPAVHTLKNLIEAGELGRIVSIGMRKPHLLNAASRPEWFFSKEQCGGIIIDLLVHDFDLLRWFTGSEVHESDGMKVKSSLPDRPGFYDAASLQVVMGNGVIAQLYADWYTPATSWTWGDGRIFVTGTEGFAELRLAGDPIAGAGTDELLLCATNQEPPRRLALEAAPCTITEDFLQRIAGKSSMIASADIIAAAKATIDADERARIVQNPVVE
ncbi:gfo/Idh/MocA family oxidoreductase [Paenibacillaceae bacterium]|nr:gfo/Idh/MocA family oxidoreductase [Paenibacillaceae bacterium]